MEYTATEREDMLKMEEQHTRVRVRGEKRKYKPRWYESNIYAVGVLVVLTLDYFLIICNIYPVYVLFLAMINQFFNQINGFCLVASNVSMANDIGYGEKECRPDNTSAVSAIIREKGINMTAMDYCLQNAYLCDASVNNGTDPGETELCGWYYTGAGLEYQILAGPAYLVLFAVSGVPMGLMCELNSLNRKWMLSVCAMLWSVVTVLAGFATEYWHVAVARVLIGVFSAGGVPFSTSIISDYFKKEHRGAAMGFFFWGVYLGYSMTFVLVIAERHLGWRSVYYLAGGPGILVALLIMITVREPVRNTDQAEAALSQLSGMLSKLRAAFRHFLSPSLMLLSLGGAIRNGAGIVWAYNIVLFFDEYQSGIKIEDWMTWIPLVFGSLGSFGGGAISDRLSANRGVKGRLILLIACLLLSAPFLLGTLYLWLPWAMLMLIPAYIIGEMWIGVCVAVVVDIMPTDLTASGVAVYFLIIQLIGGSMPMLVTPIRMVTDMRIAMLVLYPGMYVLGAILFAITLAVVLLNPPKTEKLPATTESTQTIMTEKDPQSIRL